MEMTFVSTPHGTDEQFAEFLDAVQEHLDAIGCEIQVAASLAKRTADFATSMDATSFETAATTLLADVRTALHAAGANTSDWPEFRATERHVRELEDA
jgi:hypothetical protein